MQGDILMSKSGRIGSCAVVPLKIKKGDWNIYEGIALLRLAGLDPYYAVAFLNSKYGFTQIKRELKGAAQPHLHLEDVRRIKILIPSPITESVIKNTVLSGVKNAQESHTIFTKAQRLLESELGLDKLRFDKPVGYTAKFSEIELARRLDAQHYQSRFSYLLNHLSNYSSQKIRDIRLYNRRSIQPVYVAEGEYPVVNSQHLGPQHINYDGLQKTSARAFSESPEAHINPAIKYLSF